MQDIVREAKANCGPGAHPEEVAAYIQAAAILRLALEIGGLRSLLESGSGGITVGLEKQ